MTIGVRYHAHYPRRFDYIKYAFPLSVDESVVVYSNRVEVVEGQGRTVQSKTMSRICCGATWDDQIWLGSSEGQILRIDRSLDIIESLSLHGHGTLLGMSVSANGILATFSSGKILQQGADCRIFDFSHLFKEPLSVQELEPDVFVVCDSMRHAVFIVDAQQNVFLTIGQVDQPGDGIGQFCYPLFASLTETKELLVTDQRNHRILVFDRSGRFLRSYGTTGVCGNAKRQLFCMPRLALQSSSSTFLVLEDKMGRVIHMSEDGVQQDRVGYGPIEHSDLNFPRSCEFDRASGLLAVADTLHNRVLLYSIDGRLEKSLPSERSSFTLRWPRSATWYDGRLIIADSRNRRLLIVEPDGALLREIKLSDLDHSLSSDGWIQCAELRGSRLLVSDEGAFNVFDLEQGGRLIWGSHFEGTKASDIHHCSFYDDERILVSDTGNDRVLLVGPEESRVFYDRELKSPRFCKRFGRDILLVDSGHSRVLVLTLELDVRLAYGSGRGIGTDEFSAPRWASMSDDHLYISDSDNHRIVVRALT